MQKPEVNEHNEAIDFAKLLRTHVEQRLRNNLLISK